MKTHSRIFIFIFILIASVSLGAGIVVADVDESSDVQSPPPEIDVSVEQAAVGDVAVYEVQTTASEKLLQLEFVVSSAEVTVNEGFEREELDGVEADRYVWDGETENPEFVIEKQIEESSENQMHKDEEWYFGETPFLQAYWAHEGDTEFSTGTILGIEESTTTRVGEITAADGFAGAHFVFLGEYTTETIVAGETEFNFIKVGDVSDVPTQEIADEQHSIQPYLRGEQPTSVDVFVMEDPIEIAGAASTVADESWVHEDAEREDPRNLWMHEYIHTQQEFEELGPEMEWFLEGVTVYQTAVLTHDVGLVDENEAYRYVSQDGLEEIVLANRHTWENNEGDYTKGAKMAFALDAELRAETNGDVDLQDVVAEMYATEDEITYEVFSEIVTEESGIEQTWLDKRIQQDGEIKVPDTLVSPPKTVTPTYSEPQYQHIGPISIESGDVELETEQQENNSDEIESSTVDTTEPVDTTLIVGVLVLSAVGLLVLRYRQY